LEWDAGTAWPLTVTRVGDATPAITARQRWSVLVHPGVRWCVL